MASTYVNNLRLNEMATGDASGSWGTVTNTNLEIIGQATAWGTRAIANASTDNITIADGALDADRCLGLKLTGGGQACTVTLLPNTSSKTWFMYNATSYTLTFTCGSGANVAILAGQTKIIATDGLGSGGVVHDLLTAVNLAGTTQTAAVTTQGTLTVGVDDTGYDVKFFGATSGKSLLWDESADSLIITGSTSLQGGLEVGVDDTGYDVKFFGATSGAYMLWDESADDLILGGAAGLSVNSTALVTGVLTANGGAVFNEGGADVDFRVESDADTHALFVDGANGNVVVGGSASGLYNAVGGTARITSIGSSSSTNIAGNTGASIAIANTDTTANNTAGLHFARADTDNDPNYAGASIVAQFLDTQATGQYPRGQLAFLTSTTANAAPSEKMRITDTGNVGIGLTAPTVPLHVALTTNTAAIFTTNVASQNADILQVIATGSSTSANIKMKITSGTARQAQIRLNGDGSVIFSNTTSDTERMRITDTGNVGIGTTAPDALLHLKGGNEVAKIKFEVGTSDADKFKIYASTAGRLYVNSYSGNTGVYLTYNGTSWTSNSDETLKDNITSLGTVGDKLKNYRTSYFNWKADTDKPPKRNIGFIAQDWETDFPEVVTKKEGETLGMQYTETIPILLKYIQELEARITALEG